jgi:hypothetical protein
MRQGICQPGFYPNYSEIVAQNQPESSNLHAGPGERAQVSTGLNALLTNVSDDTFQPQTWVRALSLKLK